MAPDEDQGLPSDVEPTIETDEQREARISAMQERAGSEDMLGIPDFLKRQATGPIRAPANEGTLGQIQEFDGDLTLVDPNMVKCWETRGLRFVKRMVEFRTGNPQAPTIRKPQRILQQQWFCHDTGQTEWRDVPEVEE